MPDQDKPKIDFNLDAAIKETNGAEFRFTYKGKVWKLPPPSHLPAELLLRASDKGDGEFVTAIFQHALGDRYDEFMSSVPVAGLFALADKYLRDAGVSLGEPSASAS